ncbi:MAG: RagB/SusD family nutrient uptake outer membrane protein [Flavisolibacter sp.]
MKKLIIYILAFVVFSTQQACKKDLNALPENSRVAEVAITDAKTAEIALNGAYYTFANATPIKTSWQYHEIPPAMLAGYLGYGFGALPEEENRNDGLALTDYWDESYKALNAANGVLKGLEPLSDNSFTGNRKKEMTGELHFLRAYAHFKLLSYYGEWFKLNSPNGVLLRDEASTKTNISKTRSSVKESYDFILADLDDAIANAPSENDNYYATKWAAMVLKMRVLMSRGEAADYAEVVSLANDIIQSSPYQLEAKTEDIFRSKGLSSSEVILGLKPQANQEKDYYSRSAQYWPGHSAMYVAKKALKDLLANDPRSSWLVGGPNPYSAYSPDTYFFTKYIAQGGTPTPATETYYAMRLSEVYLLKAEAIVRSGGSLSDAKMAAKEVMTHAGVTDFSAIDNANTPDDLLLQIYYETVKSLVAEDGQEWMALLRLDFNTVKQIKPTITTQAQYILPIPHSEFVYNPAIGDQNPGYSK